MMVISLKESFIIEIKVYNVVTNTMIKKSVLISEKNI